MPEEPEEQLEFLRREDIRTMAKDMAHLREEEAKKERERIIQLQGGSKGQQATAPEPSRVPLMPPGFEAIKGELPKPPSRTKKILVRVAIILLVLFIAANAIALAYSFWKGSAPGKTQIQPSRPTPPAEEPAAQREESSLPFPVEEIVAVSSAQDISQLLNVLKPQGITGVSFEAVQTPLALLKIKPPEQITSLIRPSFLLFLHTFGEKKRLGLVFTVNDNEEAVKEALSQWEPDMEKDTAPFFRLMAPPGDGYVSFFRSTQHNGVTIRFQTFSRNDFGIVYAVSHNLLIITSSLESMSVLLDTLENSAL